MTIIVKWHMKNFKVTLQISCGVTVAKQKQRKSSVFNLRFKAGKDGADVTSDVVSSVTGFCGHNGEGTIADSALSPLCNNQCR